MSGREEMINKINFKWSGGQIMVKVKLMLSIIEITMSRSARDEKPMDLEFSSKECNFHQTNWLSTVRRLAVRKSILILSI